MPRRRRNADGETRLDRIVRLYVEMTVEEKLLVRPVLSGIDQALGLKTSRVTPADQQRFEELGERAAAE